MNQLPIAFTLYYPTAAQAEAYLVFMAMMSIAFSLIYLTLPIWLWSAKKTIHYSNKTAWPVIPIGLNPIGSFVLLAAHILWCCDFIGDKMAWLWYLITPAIGLFIFSAIT